MSGREREREGVRGREREREGERGRETKRDGDRVEERNGNELAIIIKNRTTLVNYKMF